MCVCVCGKNGDYVGTETWLREKRRYGERCLCCVLKCVVQYFGNDATFLAPQQTLTNSSHMKLQHNRQFDAIVCRGVKVFGMASFLAQTFTRYYFDTNTDRLHLHEINVIPHKHSLTAVCVDSTQSLQLRICECSHDIAVT